MFTTTPRVTNCCRVTDDCAKTPTNFFEAFLILWHVAVSALQGTSRNISLIPRHLDHCCVPPPPPRSSLGNMPPGVGGGTVVPWGGGMDGGGGAGGTRESIPSDNILAVTLFLDKNGVKGVGERDIF